MSDTVVNGGYDVGSANFSSTDNYFQFDRYRGKFNIEGTWMLKWSLIWLGCTAKSIAQGLNGNNSYKAITNSSSTGVLFTIKNGAQAVDFAAPTHENDCSADGGIAIDITDTLKVPSGLNWHGVAPGEACAVLATSTPTANTCQVKIDSAAAASMSASMDPMICKGTTNLPIGCPPPNKSSAKDSSLGAYGP